MSLLIACLGSAGCQRDREPAAGGHELTLEVKTAQINVFGERHEIFAEHRLVVAGTPTKFVTHVTDLKTLLPRREGPIAFTLQAGQEAPIEKTEGAPVRAGIYEAMLTFPKAGEWQVTVGVPAEDGVKKVRLTPVNVFPSTEEALKAPQPEAPVGISFLKEQQWKVLSGTGIAAKRKLIERLRLPATVSARPGKLAQVTPPVAGRLLPPPGKSMPLVGDKVEAGQTLGLVQPTFSEIGARFMEAEADVVRSKLSLEQADAVLKRTQKLAEASARSARELEEAQFALKAAQAKYDAALMLQATYRKVGANFSEAGTAVQPMIDLKSPIAGTIVAQLGAAVGEYLPVEKPVFTVLDVGIIFIEARIPEASLKRLGAVEGAKLELPDDPGRFLSITGDGRGRLVFLGPQVDPATRTVPLVFEAKNEGGHLRIGQSLNLYVESSRAEDALAIPTSSIVDEDGKPVAFVQVGGEAFQKRDLALGIRDEDFVQVLSGIAEGERVVTKGAYAIRLASVSSAIPAHGHVH